ncbi:phage portal protein [Xenorhabdus hominickii]|nr:phage portal protein [Xenorhabdus hominickii]
MGVPIGLLDGTFWQEWTGMSSSGRTVSADSALQLSTVWACVRLLSETVSTLPLKIYQSKDDGSRQLAKNHPAYTILCNRPNLEMTQSRFMLTVVASICLRGNAFIEKKFIGNKLVALIPLLPQNMNVKRLLSGDIEYTYADSAGKNQGERRIIPVKNMMHIRGFGIDGLSGLIPVKTGRDVIGAALSTDEAAAKVFENGLQSSGFISAKTDLTEEQTHVIQQHIKTFTGSKNAGKMMVLPADLTYQNITMNPEAAQLLQSRSYSVEEICRWFRVPPVMVGHSTKQSSWASSLEGMNMQFLTHTLRPLLINIEQEISRCLLDSDSDYYAEFNVEGLLRADSRGRAAYYATALQNAWMSRNEVRRKENLPPIEGGDVFTVQLNLTPIDLLGEEQAKKPRSEDSNNDDEEQNARRS